jgi:hypothetical protein
MQSNPTPANRTTTIDPARPKFYDPSEPYRALLKPTNNPKPENPTMAYDVPTTNIDLKTGVPKQIPQYFYPIYDGMDGPPIQRPEFAQPQPQRPAPVLQQPPAPAHQAIPVVVQQPPVPNIIQPYHSPIGYPADPYASAQYYPYGQPYLIPLTSAVPHAEPAPIVHERSKSDVIAAHQQDADLSRLEVYHFTPKQDGHSKGTALAQASQPIIQYHVYPPGAAAAPPPPQQLPPPPPQQYPPYSQPWSNYPPNGPPFPPNGHPYPPNGPPYMHEPPPLFAPLAETKARASQTEQPPTKNRGVSPMYTTAPPPPLAPAPYDEDGYPYIHHRKTHTDRRSIPTGRIDRQFYDINRTTPLADCRCLDCQQERTKVLNYHPD